MFHIALLLTLLFCIGSLVNISAITESLNGVREMNNNYNCMCCQKAAQLCSHGNCLGSKTNNEIDLLRDLVRTSILIILQECQYMGIRCVPTYFGSVREWRDKRL